MVNIITGDVFIVLVIVILCLRQLGRQVVRRWLNILDRKLDGVEESLDYNQYKDLVEWSSAEAFLPERTNFIGCQGINACLYDWLSLCPFLSLSSKAKPYCISIFARLSERMSQGLYGP